MASTTYFDSHGWATKTPLAGRLASTDPSSMTGSPVVGQPWPNWNETLKVWDELTYVEPNTTPMEPIPKILPPPSVKSWAPMTFYRLFTETEHVAALNAAKTDTTVEFFLKFMDNAISSGTPVMANDPIVTGGLDYFSANPSSAPILASGRSATILAS